MSTSRVWLEAEIFLYLQSSGVDLQHAVVEYSENEDCYVLQDLNTTKGTYVNDCRVQNAAVRLAPGDLIRFGQGSVVYELVGDSTQVCQNSLKLHTFVLGTMFSCNTKYQIFNKGFKRHLCEKRMFLSDKANGILPFCFLKKIFDATWTMS